MQLVSDSVKTKQAHNTLMSQKQALAKQLQQINTSIEHSKTRITHSEEQVKPALLSDPSLPWPLYFLIYFDFTLNKYAAAAAYCCKQKFESCRRKLFYPMPLNVIKKKNTLQSPWNLQNGNWLMPRRNWSCSSLLFPLQRKNTIKFRKIRKLFKWNWRVKGIFSFDSMSNLNQG